MRPGTRDCRLAWLAVGLSAGALEALALRRHPTRDTLSYCTRAVFRTDTWLGKHAFMACWLAFLIHIVGGKNAPRS